MATVRPAPELLSAGDAAAHYDDREACRYDSANAKVQEELAGRCCELLGLPSSAPALLLDAGCGSCLSAFELKKRHPLCAWLGLDVSQAMLQRARDGGALAHGGDLVLCDMSQPLPLRADCLFDGVVSQQTGGDVKLTYLEKLGGGWSLAGIADYSGAHGASGEVELGKSW